MAYPLDHGLVVNEGGGSVSGTPGNAVIIDTDGETLIDGGTPPGGSGTTNIVIAESPTGVEVQSSSGTNDTIALANGTNAGAMSPGDYTKLLNIETAATADQTDGEIETAYNNQVGVVSQAEAEAGVATTVRRWTAERVKQAIDALAGSVSVSDVAYGPTWDGDTTTAASKNAIYDQLEAISASGVSDGDKGDITVSVSGSVWTVDVGAITLAKQADLAQSTIIGRAAGAGTGVPTALTATQVRTLINVADGATAAGATGDAYATSHEADSTAHDDAEIVAAGSATNYTPGTATVDGHLAAIDTALGTVGGEVNVTASVGSGDVDIIGSPPKTGLAHNIRSLGNNTTITWSVTSDKIQATVAEAGLTVSRTNVPAVDTGASRTMAIATDLGSAGRQECFIRMSNAAAQYNVVKNIAAVGQRFMVQWTNATPSQTTPFANSGGGCSFLPATQPAIDTQYQTLCLLCVDATTDANVFHILPAAL